MPKVLYVDFKGVSTSQGTLARPESSLRSAINVTVDAPGIIRKRFGLKTTASSTAATQLPAYVHKVVPATAEHTVVSSGSSAAPTNYVYANTVNLYEKTKQQTNGTKLTTIADPSATYSDFPATTELVRPTVVDFPVGKLQAVAIGKKIFFTTGKGVQRFDDEGGTFYRRPAGVTQGIDLRYSPTTVGSTRLFTDTTNNWLLNGYAVGYRTVYFQEDADGRRIYGAPSGKMVVWNNTAWDSVAGIDGTAKAVSIVPVIPPCPGATTGAPTSLGNRSGICIYRTTATDLNAGLWPDDIYYLVQEKYFTTAEVTGASAVAEIADLTPNDKTFLGKELYTNNAAAESSGLAGGNFCPENFLCLSEWRNRLWGSCFNTRHKLELTMIGVPTDGDRITVNGEEFVFKVTPSASNHVRISPAGALSAKLFFTMQALVSAISASKSSHGVIARMQSASGQFTLSQAGVTALLEHCVWASASTAGSHNITVEFSSSTVAARFRPLNAESVTFAITSQSDINQTTVMCSKLGEPDAFPATEDNVFQLGDSNLTILNMLSIEEGLYIFTTRGLFLVSERNESSFRVDAVDETAILVGSECVTRCDGALWAWLTQGFARIKGGRVEYVSQPIQDQLDRYAEALHGRTASISFFAMKKADAYSFCSSDTAHGRVFLFLPTTTNFT